MNTRALSPLLLAAAALLATVGLAGCSKPPASPVAASTAPTDGAQVSDIDVTEHVKTALLQSATLQGQEIAVSTLKGDVKLVGVLASRAQVDEAIRIARAAQGAHSIHDELTVKP